MKIKVIIIFLALITLYGCSKPNSDPENAPGMPIVSPEQAEKVARDEYGLTKVETVQSKTLTEDEMENLNKKQMQLTPVYYEVSGLIEDEIVNVYVSSNEIEHHFIIKENPK